MLFWKKKPPEAPEPEKEPEPAMPEKPETQLEKWNKRLTAYTQLANGVSVDAKGKPVLDERTQKYFADLAALDKDQNDFKVFVGGQLPLDKALLICESGALPWWVIKTGRAYCGDIEGLKKIHDRIDVLKAQQPNPSSMMTWVCYPHSLVDGYSNKLTNHLIDAVFDMGADVNHDNGTWLEKAMRCMNETGVKCFISRGADAAVVTRVLAALRDEKDHSQVKIVEDALRCTTLSGKIDDQILLQATFSPEGTTLKSYFNFATRRVQEVHVQPGRPDGAMVSLRFEDYDGGAIEDAQKALKKLGGKPTPYVRPGSTGFG
jgi:hypothetical protein